MPPATLAIVAALAVLVTLAAAWRSTRSGVLAPRPSPRDRDADPDTEPRTGDDRTPGDAPDDSTPAATRLSRPPVPPVDAAGPESPPITALRESNGHAKITDDQKR